MIINSHNDAYMSGYISERVDMGPRECVLLEPTDSRFRLREDPLQLFVITKS
jgi:hypothetical protein